jgi:hypothetical protein
VNDSTIRSGLEFLQGGDYALQIMTIPRSMFFSEPPDLGDNWIFTHGSTASSSGEHSIGHAKPKASMASAIRAFVCALLMCLKFHVSK